MTPPSIGPGDADYATAMREAKALFEAAMAKSAIKGRGRPAAAKTVTQPVADEADDVDLSDITELAEVDTVAEGGDGDASTAPAADAPELVAAPEPTAAPEPEAPKPPARKRAPKPRGRRA